MFLLVWIKLNNSILWKNKMPHPEFLNNNWKKAIAYLLNEGGLLVPINMVHPYHEKHLGEIFQGDEFQGVKESILGGFYEQLGFTIDTSKDIRIEKLNIIRRSSMLMQKLAKLELVDSEEDEDCNERYYSLNTKGLDISLKLQEHIDNERRFEQQVKISETVKRINFFSVCIALIALILLVSNYKISQKRLEISEDSLSIAIKRLDRLENTPLFNKERIQVKNKSK
jgi:hypothetical protein